MRANANAGCSLGSTAETSKRGRAPRERAVSLLQWTFVGHRPYPTSAARHARAASAGAAPPPDNFPVRTREQPLLVGGRCWQVRVQPCTEKEGRLARAVGFYRARADSNRHGAACTRRKRACCATSRDRACREQRMVVGGRGRHVGAWVCTAGEGRLVGVLCFHRGTDRVQQVRRGARAPQTLVLRHLERESAR